MRMLKTLAVALAVVVGLALVAQAGEEGKPITVTGKVMCAKCTLKKADAKECQDVLVAEEKDGKVEYYLVKNEALQKFGHTCTGEKTATATGKVTEKEGKKWLDASKIEEVKKG